MAQSFRSDEMHQKYATYRAQGGLNGPCVLCNEIPIHTFSHWKIIANKFPYDNIAEIHEMIIPLRHVTEQFLTPEERAEYMKIKDTYLEKYNYIIEAMPLRKSIPEHFHLHLIIN